MTAEVLDLPILIAGEQMYPGRDAYNLRYEEAEFTVRLARPDLKFADIGSREALMALSSIPLDDLTVFFEAVRARWIDPNNEWRQKAIKYSSKTTGYHPLMTQADIDYLDHSLLRAKQYDFIETDLGDPALLDDWQNRKAVKLRCMPKGVVVHVMVGNVPLASLFTFYRSLITKNVTVAKVPSRDVVTSLCFANTIHDTDPNHPVSRALSALYWEAESELENEFISKADVVCVWGRGATVNSIKSRLPAGVDLIEFGPKRSMAVIRERPAQLGDTALRLAYDAIAYDQEACFSVQEVFVQDGASELGHEIARKFASAETLVPRRTLSIDADAHVHRARMEAKANGWKVIAPSDGSTSWTVVITDKPTEVHSHPLGRFLYLHPITALSDVFPFVDSDVQTVALYPWNDVETVSLEFLKRGADRIVQPGRVSRFRPGVTHDGMYPMRQMVRWVIIEREIKYKYRFTGVSPEQYDQGVFGRVFPPEEIAAVEPIG